MPDPTTHATPIIVPVEDDPIHTDTSPFCAMDPTCGCHEDPLLTGEVAQAVNEGLLTPDEATDFVAGTLLSWHERRPL